MRPVFRLVFPGLKSGHWRRLWIDCFFAMIWVRAIKKTKSETGVLPFRRGPKGILSPGRRGLALVVMRQDSNDIVRASFTHSYGDRPCMIAGITPTHIRRIIGPALSYEYRPRTFARLRLPLIRTSMVSAHSYEHQPHAFVQVSPPTQTKS